MLVTCDRYPDGHGITVLVKEKCLISNSPEQLQPDSFCASDCDKEIRNSLAGRAPEQPAVALISPNKPLEIHSSPRRPSNC